MRKLAYVIAGVMLCGAVYADVVEWEEDFDDVSGWSTYNGGPETVISNQSGLGYLHVDVLYAGYTNATFIAPNQDGDRPGAFIPTRSGDYTLTMLVQDCDWNQSYIVDMDQFDSSYGYISTVGGIIPQQTTEGSVQANLGGFSWDPSAAYISPKIYMSIGDAGYDQTMVVDNLSITSTIPEPASAALLSLGVVGSMLVRRHRRRRQM